MTDWTTRAATSAASARPVARGALRRLVPAVVAMVTAGAGCSVLVSGEVPAFQCTAGAGACPSGMTCDLATNRCVETDGATGIDAPDVEETGAEDAPIDSDGGPVGPANPGSPCRVNGDCKSGVCGTSTILTPTITAGPGPICTTACCTSSDCGAGFVCFNGGTGGGYCVPAQLANRNPPATGGKTPGSTCTNNTDCRSGFCERLDGGASRCLDTCCTKSVCATGTECRLRTVAAPPPAHTVWACAAAEGSATKEVGDQCVETLECKTDNCIGVSSGRICRPPCGNTADCRGLVGFSAGHCLYGSADNDYFRFCFNATTTTDSPAGAACTNETTCQSDYCDKELGTCMDVCGRDLDCPAGHACRPSGVATPFLRCVPR